MRQGRQLPRTQSELYWVCRAHPRLSSCPDHEQCLQGTRPIIQA